MLRTCPNLSWCRQVSDAAAISACKSYGVSEAWVQTVADSTLGIIAVESKFGQSARYRIKGLLHGLFSGSDKLKQFAPRGQGLAQVNQDRADYLVADAMLDHTLDIWQPEGAMQATALGLAKAISLHYPDRPRCPSRTEAAIVVITHNAGWMAPRVARLQNVLARFGMTSIQFQTNGFVGPMTVSALDRAAQALMCPTLAETMQRNGFTDPPAWGLTHPDLFPVVRESALFRSLSDVARRLGEDLDEPLLPGYRFRRWHTGWITSHGYTEAVLSYLT